MQLQDFIERRFIECAAHQPRLVAIAEEVALTEVFDPDQSFIRIMIINSRRANAVLGEKLGDLDIVPVFFTLQIIFNENERLLGRTADPIKTSIRAAFFDRSDLYLIEIDTWEMQAGAMKQEIGRH